MPIYQITKDLIFPHPELASEDGILGIGGDLSPQRLLLAYRNGIFPWFSKEDPILWWSPDPRFVLFPEKICVSRSMQKLLRKDVYQITYDRAFREVITQCGALREHKEGTWITEDMVEAYCKLHQLGFAHSVETWYEGKLVGGLYGISLGRCFFGESMFSRMDNASKAAFITLTRALIIRQFLLIDCQVYTKHLESLGAENISRKAFLQVISRGVQDQTIQGKWTGLL